MPDVVGKAEYDLTVDTTGVTKGLKTAETQIKTTGATAEKAFGQQTTGALSKVDGALKKMTQSGGITGAILGGVGIGAGLGVFSTLSKGIGAVTDMMGEAVTAASDLNETQTKLDAVFVQSAGSVRAWAKDSAHSMGLSTQAALEAAGTFGNFLQAMGQTEPVAAKMSEAMVQLAVDLGSFNNADPSEVLLALRSGLSGEVEPLRKFGVDISDAAVKAHLLAAGVKAVGGQFTQSEKIQARYDLILKQTTRAQGDFAKTSGGLANSQKTLAAVQADFSAKLGTFLQGPAISFTKFLTDVVTGLGNITEALGDNSRKVDSYATEVQILGERYGFTAAKAAEVAAQVDSLGFVFVDGATDAEKHAERLAAVDEAMRALALGMVDFKARAEEWRPAFDGIGVGINNVSDAVKGLAASVADPVPSDIAALAGSVGLVADAIVKFRAAAPGSFDALGVIIDNVKLLQAHFKELPPAMQEAMRFLGVAVDQGVKHVGGALHQLPVIMAHAVLDMYNTIKDGKKGIIAEFRDLAWQEKHPWAEVNFAKWLQHAHDRAMKLSRQAVKDGRPGLAAEYKGAADDAIAEMNRLPGVAAKVSARVTAEITSAAAAILHFLDIFGNGPTVTYPGRAHHGSVHPGSVNAPPSFTGPAAAAPSAGPSGRQDVFHHITADGARNLRAAGYDDNGVAGLLMAASRDAGLRFTDVRR